MDRFEPSDPLSRLRAMTVSHDPDFDDLRASICRNLHAVQRGLEAGPFHTSLLWDEGIFWDRFTDGIRNGEFDGFLRSSPGAAVSDIFAIYGPHFAAGRFDHVIRAWAGV